MATNDTLKRLIDAGMSFTQMSQSRAEGIVNDLVKQGELRKKEAQQAIESLVARGRESSEKLIALIQHEVSSQVGRISSQVEALEHRIEDLAKMVGLGGAAGKVADLGSSVAGTVSSAFESPADRVIAMVEEASASKTAASKTAVKKSPVAKQAAPVKSAAKKTAAAAANAAGPVEAAAKKAASPAKTAAASAKKAAASAKKAAAPVKKAAAKKAAPVTAATKKVALGKRPAKKAAASTAD